MANDSFIDHRCQICGGTDIADMALSEVIVNAGYGSKHDGQQLRLAICGECVEKILSKAGYSIIAKWYSLAAERPNQGFGRKE